MKFKSLLSLLLFFIVGFASAQITSSTINGKVTDGDFPIANVFITITYLPTNSIYETETDKKGRFSLDNLEVGGPFKIEVKGATIENYSRSGFQLLLGDNDLPKPIMVRKKETTTQVLSSNDKEIVLKSI
ncbi:carboxypeptidase-like regulatory domain-containing protein [Flavobacterium sp.]|uniref:carboxypeptidase-like regulatory domain-containing protein n=1 Tax=Flavobacterium sp. TaxID=239 RepID=UPI003BCA50F2